LPDRHESPLVGAIDADDDAAGFVLYGQLLVEVIAVVVAVIALLIGGLASYDWDPVSEEQLAAAEQTITGTVYWTQFGHVYHISEDCSHLNRSDTITYGDVDQAVAANKSRLCKTCATKYGIEGVATNE